MGEKEQQFFNQLAAQWDDIRCSNDTIITALVALVGFRAGDRVLDVGCGTGVLVPYVKKAVGASGIITAVDFAGNMIARAIEKYKDMPGIKFIVADIMEYEAEDNFDKIVCFNFFPHVHDKPVFLRKMAGMLTSGGALVIMHDMPRNAVNAIHGDCHAVQNDHLPKGEKTAMLLAEAGLRVATVIDNDRMYFVKAIRDRD